MKGNLQICTANTLLRWICQWQSRYFQLQTNVLLNKKRLGRECSHASSFSTIAIETIKGSCSTVQNTFLTLFIYLHNLKTELLISHVTLGTVKSKPKLKITHFKSYQVSKCSSIPQKKTNEKSCWRETNNNRDRVKHCTKCLAHLSSKRTSFYGH